MFSFDIGKLNSKNRLSEGKQLGCRFEYWMIANLTHSRWHDGMTLQLISDIRSISWIKFKSVSKMLEKEIHDGMKNRHNSIDTQGQDEP